MSLEDEARRYFGQAGFERFLRRLMAQYKASSSGARGYVTLSNLSDDERQTLNQFYRTYSPPVPNETKRFSIRRFEKYLQESRFALTVPDLLMLLSGDDVRTKLEQRNETDAQWRSMIAGAIAAAGLSDKTGDPVCIWARGLEAESSPGSRTLRYVFVRSSEEAERCLRVCLKALLAVQERGRGEWLRLPILSARVTGDAHALDWKNSLGRMFWWGLTVVGDQSNENGFDMEVGERETSHIEKVDAFAVSVTNAIVIREVYRRGGIADDDLSSQVMLYAPSLFSQCEERILTLRQVEQLSASQSALFSHPTVYMVENPAVFAELIDADRKLGEADSRRSPIIICGNGQPSVAVIKLLDWLLGRGEGFASEDRELYYAGDLDAAGLSIAQGLRSRYPEHFRAWCMSASTYLSYVDQGIGMGAEERGRMMQFVDIWDSQLPVLMNEHGVKLHQELWVDELVRDMERRCERR
ncbi:TIGR02679 domain-containing protein [Paenibacillus sp. HB172176]|uniref:TIGR02679 domain-containing protein n=1 Tax=Paenibacillus sp. HB172176 TaxID=2493690 RepID=UPI001438A27D|nr:TIGR02679 domain-containing protein [Paenibacillus sp. HB172176]